MFFFFFFFFFQAEDGIRDRNVTGVQTCALRSRSCTWERRNRSARPCRGQSPRGVRTPRRGLFWSGRPGSPRRSEERRVGKECRSRWGEGRGRKERERSEG